MRKPELAGFEIEGAEMAVRLAADPENPPLLLTHGTPKLLGILPQRNRHREAGGFRAQARFRLTRWDSLARLDRP